jgi:CRP-like cAMP-binding protein
MTHVELLRGTEIFAKLTDAELDAVARCISDQEAAAGDIVIREGQPGESLYVIRSGRVLIEKTHADRKIKLTELGRGAVFGEMSLIDSFPTSATVTAIEASSFLAIGRLDLNVLLTWDTVLGSKMWRSFTEMLCYRLRATNLKLMQRYGDSGAHDLLSATVDIEAK